MSKLKLAWVNGEKVKRLRSITVTYSGGGYGIGTGHAISVHNAIAAATRRLLAKEYKAAEIKNENGIVVCKMRRMSNAIEILGIKKGTV